MMKTFNINNSIKVRLKNKGYEVLTYYRNGMHRLCPDRFKCVSIEEVKSQADEDGYISFQMWSFIKIFGEYTDLRNNDYYETEIIIDEKNLSDYICLDDQIKHIEESMENLTENGGMWNCQLTRLKELKSFKN